MWGITTRVLPLVVAFELQVLANRECRAKRMGVLAPCAGLAIVIDFSPRVRVSPTVFSLVTFASSQALTIALRSLRLWDV
jgi:hypothetical protein